MAMCLEFRKNEVWRQEHRKHLKLQLKMRRAHIGPWPQLDVRLAIGMTWIGSTRKNNQMGQRGLSNNRN